MRRPRERRISTYAVAASNDPTRFAVLNALIGATALRMWKMAKTDKFRINPDPERHNFRMIYRWVGKNRFFGGFESE